MDTAAVLGYFGVIDESSARGDTNRVDEATANRQSASGAGGGAWLPFGGLSDAFGEGLDTIAETRDGVLATVQQYFETAGEIAPWVAASVIAVTAGLIVLAIAGVIIVFKVL